MKGNAQTVAPATTTKVVVVAPSEVVAAVPTEVVTAVPPKAAVDSPDVGAELLPVAAAAPDVGAELLPTAAAASSAAPPSATSTPPTSPTSKIAVLAAPNKELRRSIRNAASTDVHTLHKAEWLMAKKNLEFPGNSFTSFPNSKILSNLGRIDINLDTLVVMNIKNLEVDRLVLCANKKMLYQT